MYSKSKERNIIYNFIFTGMSYAFPVISLLYISRVLMPEMLGRVSFASSVAVYFTIFARLGMPIYGLRICASHRHDRQMLSRTVSELLLINLVLSAVSFAVLTVSTFAVPRFAADRCLLLITGSGILLQSVGCEWLYKALEEYRYITVRSFFVKLAALICMLLFVRSSGDYILYAVLSVLSASGIYIINALRLGRYADISLRGKLPVLQHIKPLLTFFLMSCATTVYDSLDTLMLGFMKTSYELGLYSVVGKSKVLLTMLGGVIWNVTLPDSTRLWAEGSREGFEALAKKSISLVLLLQLPLTVFGLLFAERLVFIIGGEKYLPAAAAFRITLLSVVPIGLSNIMGGQVLIPAGFEKKLLYTELLAAGTNFVLNLLIIPRYSIEGAAFTTVIAEVLVWLLAQYYIRRETGIKMFAPAGIRKQLLSALAAGAVLFAASRFFVFSGGSLVSVLLQTGAFAAIFGSVYLCFLLLLKEPSSKEILKRIFSR